MKVFVIADKMTKNICNDFYTVPAGAEDVFLSGKHKYNPFNGNPFRFDNNEGEGVEENRKRNNRKFAVILAIAVAVGFVVGLLLTSELLDMGASKDKTFSSDGMSITLTREFREVDIASFTVSYGSPDVAVYVLKEPFSTFDGAESYSVEKYANMIVLANDLDADVTTVDDLVTFEYEFTNPDSGKTYRYFSYAYKSGDAFWMVQIAMLTEDVATYESQILNWAKSVTFDE